MCVREVMREKIAPWLKEHRISKLIDDLRSVAATYTTTADGCSRPRRGIARVNYRDAKEEESNAMKEKNEDEDLIFEDSAYKESHQNIASSTDEEFLSNGEKPFSTDETSDQHSHLQYEEEERLLDNEILTAGCFIQEENAIIVGSWTAIHNLFWLRAQRKRN